MNEMGADLEALMARYWRGEKVMSDIIKRHAMPWYDGDIEETQRLADFLLKVEVLVVHVSHLEGQELMDAWVDGICAIDESYDPDKPSYLERIDFSELGRHLFNGGTQWGMANNIKRQLDDMIEQDKVVQFETARKRFADGQ